MPEFTERHAVGDSTSFTFPSKTHEQTAGILRRQHQNPETTSLSVTCAHYTVTQTQPYRWPTLSPRSSLHQPDFILTFQHTGDIQFASEDQ